MDAQTGNYNYVQATKNTELLQSKSYVENQNHKADSHFENAYKAQNLNFASVDMLTSEVIIFY
jgi:hypothetical protein